MPKKATNPQNLKRAAGPGRPKGSKNKIPGDLKEEIIQIKQELDEKGIGLKAKAIENPTWFLEKFVIPLIPKAVTGDFNVSVTSAHQDIEKMTDEELQKELQELRSRHQKEN